jgi:hypothetical protein
MANKIFAAYLIAIGAAMLKFELSFPDVHDTVVPEIEEFMVNRMVEEGIDRDAAVEAVKAAGGSAQWAALRGVRATF